jgi:hypothetical protein
MIIIKKLVILNVNKYQFHSFCDAEEIVAMKNSVNVPNIIIKKK